MWECKRSFPWCTDSLGSDEYYHPLAIRTFAICLKSSNREIWWPDSTGCQQAPFNVASYNLSPLNDRGYHSRLSTETVAAIFSERSLDGQSFNSTHPSLVKPTERPKAPTMQTAGFWPISRGGVAVRLPRPSRSTDVVQKRSRGRPHTITHSHTI